jgi:hypothetical protein
LATMSWGAGGRRLAPPGRFRTELTVDAETGVTGVALGDTANVGACLLAIARHSSGWRVCAASGVGRTRECLRRRGKCAAHWVRHGRGVGAEWMGERERGGSEGEREGGSEWDLAGPKKAQSWPWPSWVSRAKGA